MFDGDDVDTIIANLKEYSDEALKELMSKIMRVGKEKHFSALTMDVDKLVEWIKEVIKENNLKAMGIMVSTGSACDSTNTQMSHVLKAIKIPEEYGFGTIRISFNHENTEEDAKYIAESIGKILTTVTKAKLKRS